MSAFLRRLSFGVGLGCLMLQACTPPPARLLDDAARQPPDDRESVVIVEQEEAHARIEPYHAGDAPVTNGGPTAAVIGLITTWIIEAIIESTARTELSEADATRNALVDYDFDHHALQTTQATLAKLSGFDSSKVALSKDGSKDHVLRLIDQSGSSQFLVARYAYALSPNFSQIIVSLEADIYSKDTKGGSSSDRVSAGSALYLERFSYVESLPDAANDVDENAQRWNQNGAQPARNALEAGLSGVENLFMRSMSLTPEAVSALDKGRGTDLAGFHGSLVEVSDKGTLLYNSDTGAWIFVDGLQPSK